MGQVVNPVTLEKGLRAEFMKAFNAYEDPAIMGALMKVNSSAAVEKFGWLGQSPMMQEFKDEKTPKGLLDFDYTLKNIPYEATIGVDKFALRNDQLGATQIRIRDLAGKARLFPIKKAIELLTAGTTNLAYDGLAFFSASHAEGSSGTQSNLLTGSGVTLANLTTDFYAARAAMWGYLDDTGEPMFDGQPLDLVVVCKPGLQGLFEQLFTAATVSTGGDNTLKGAAKVCVSARLTDNDWYVLNMAGAVKPLIHQENMPLEFGALEGNSDEGFKRRNYMYGVEWYGNFGYGLWQKAVKINN